MGVVQAVRASRHELVAQIESRMEAFVMNLKKLVVGAVVTSSLIAAGCGGDDPGAEGLCTSGTCAAHVYLMNELTIPTMDEDGNVPGFNIDGVVSTTASGCEVSGVACNAVCDATSPAPDNIAGVDNSVGPTLGGLVMSMIQDNVDDGSVLLVMQLDGVDSFTNDNQVKLTIFLAEKPEGATLAHEASGRLSPGQASDINELSFTDAAHTSPMILFANGKIINGRFQAGPADFPLSISLMGASLSLTVHSTQLRFNVSETLVSGGVLGGGLNVAEVNATVAATPALAEYATVVNTTLMSFADLDPNSEGVCESASVAMTFAGVGATLTGDIVASPSAGTDAGVGGTDAGGGGSDAGVDAGPAT